jgi:hypothetical protein
LPYAVANCSSPSFRPQEEAIQTVISFSGKAVFDEVIDHDALSDLEDPCKSALLAPR